MQIQEARAAFTAIAVANNTNADNDKILAQTTTHEPVRGGYERTFRETLRPTFNSEEAAGIIHEVTTRQPHEREMLLTAMVEQLEAKQIEFSITPEQLRTLRGYARMTGGDPLSERFYDAITIWPGHHVAQLRDQLNGRTGSQMYYLFEEVLNSKNQPLDRTKAMNLLMYIGYAGGLPAPHAGHEGHEPQSVQIPINQGEWRKSAVGLLTELRDRVKHGQQLVVPEARTEIMRGLEDLVHTFGIEELKGAFAEPRPVKS